MLNIETTIRKITNSVEAIISRELTAKVGVKFKIIKIDATIVLPPVRITLFAHAANWKELRDRVSTEYQDGTK
ncbi:antitoxin MazE [Lactiplantibacillus paraplantarum]|uniref:antitoxin MazE n=1 Tax=Lactiplantibacillus paraplantarum TaxID=60520 RepID=UPI00207432C3|nr:antitoxin MazE [Lactiplantibacillus paraplantarum]